MCLGIPAKINKLKGSYAEVLIGNIKKDIALDILDDEVTVGDYVILHSGFALKKIDEKEAKITLELLGSVSYEVYK